MITELVNYTLENPKEAVIYAGVLTFWAGMAYLSFEALLIHKRNQETKRQHLDNKLTQETNEF